jgi:hypothetical protein
MNATINLLLKPFDERDDRRLEIITRAAIHGRHINLYPLCKGIICQLNRVVGNFL